MKVNDKPSDPWLQSIETDEEKTKEDDFGPSDTAQAVQRDRQFPGPRTVQRDLQPYREEGISDDAVDNQKLYPQYQDLDLLRAKEEGIVETFAQEGIKTVFQTLGTTVEQAGYLLDFPAMVESIQAFGEKFVDPTLGPDEYEEAGNWLSDAANDFNQVWEEMLPTYRQNPQDVFDFSDPAFYAKNIGNLIETIGAFAATGKGLGLAAKGAGGILARGLSSGQKVNSILGGAKTLSKIRTGQQVFTSLGVSYAEGMMVGREKYKQTKRRVRNELADREDLDQEEINERAERAGRQAWATTGAVNAVLLTALNYMSVSPLFRSKRSLTSLKNPRLARQGGETAEAMLSRIDDEAALPNLYQKEGKALLREGAFEAVEETSAQIAGREGEYAALSEEGLDSADFGERLTEAVFSKQTALESALGFIGGVGQHGIMRRIPTQEAPEGESGRFFDDYISQAELENLREREFISKDKENLKDRLKTFIEAQEELQNAETEQEARRAQEKLFQHAMADNVARGVEHQMLSFMKDIENLDEGKAEELGFGDDYKKRAQEKIEEVQKYTQRYKELVDQYDFSAQEEFAGIPKYMLSYEMERDYADQAINDIEDQIDEVRRGEEEAMNPIEQSVARNEFKDRRIRDAEEKNQILDDIISAIENVDSERSREFNLEEAASREDTPALEELNRQLSKLSQRELNEIFNTTSDINVNKAAELLRRLRSRREVETQQIREEQPDEGAYAQFLEDHNLDDTQAAREVFETYRDSARRFYDEQVSRLEDHKMERTIQKVGAQANLNYLQQAENRRDLTRRAKKLFENEASSTADTARKRLKAARSIEEVRQIKDETPDIIIENMGEEVFDEREEELEDKEMKSTPEAETEDTTEETTTEDTSEGTQQETEEGPDLENRPMASQEEREAEPEAQEGEAKSGTDIWEEAGIDELVGDEQAEEIEVDYDSARESTEQYARNNLDFENQDISEMEDDVESFIEDNFSEDLDDTELQDLKSDFLGENGFVRNKKSALKFSNTPENKDFNPQDVVGVINVTNDPSSLKYHREIKDEEKSRSNGKNAVTGSSVGYKSKEYQEVERDGETVKVDKYTDRSDDMEEPLVEHPEYLTEGDRVTLKPEDINENRNYEDVAEEDIKSERIGIYRDGNLVGFLWETNTIDNNNTTEDNNNVEQQRRVNLGIRKAVIRNYLNNGQSTQAKVDSKSPGNLSNLYKTNEEGVIKEKNGYLVKDYDSATNALPQEDLPFYVMRPGSIDTNDGQDYNLINNDEFFEGNEGSIGVIVEMGNGNHLAVPLWSPRLEELGVEDTVTDLIMESIKDEKQSFENVDLNNSQEYKKQLQNYIHTSNYSPSQVYQDDRLVGRNVPIVIAGVETGNITIGIPGSGVVYTSNEQFHTTQGYEPIEGNRDAIRDIVSQLRFNVDGNRINNFDQGRDSVIPGPDASENIVTRNNAGELEVESVDNYNKHIKRYLRTDVDGTYSVEWNGEERYIYAEQPVIKIELDNQVQRDDNTKGVNKDPNPSANTPTTTDEGPTPEETENNNQGDVDGDTEQVTTPDNKSETTGEYDERAEEIATEILESDQYETVDDYIEDNQQNSIIEFISRILSGESVTEAKEVLENNQVRKAMDRLNEIIQSIPEVVRNIIGDISTAQRQSKENTDKARDILSRLTKQYYTNLNNTTKSDASIENYEELSRENLERFIRSALSVIAERLQNGKDPEAEITLSLDNGDRWVIATDIRAAIGAARELYRRNNSVEQQINEDTVESSTAKDLRDQIEAVIEQRQPDDTTLEDIDDFTQRNNQSRINSLESTSDLENIYLDAQEMIDVLEYNENIEEYEMIQYKNSLESLSNDVRERLAELGYTFEDSNIQQPSTGDTPGWAQEGMDELMNDFDTYSTDSRINSDEASVEASQSTNEDIREAFQEENIKISCRRI